MPLNAAAVARAGLGAMTYRQDARPTQVRKVSPAGQAVTIQKNAALPTVIKTRKAAIAATLMSIGVVILAANPDRIVGASVKSADLVSK